MSLLDQPEELLIEQISQLRASDLWNICRTSREFESICRSPQLWINKIRKDYPEVDLRQIYDPRSYYFSRALFTGEIFLDFIRQPDQVVDEDQVISLGEMLSEQLPEPALVVYSNSYGNQINLVGYSVNGKLVLGPGPQRRINRIDILTEKSLPIRMYYELANLNQRVSTNPRGLSGVEKRGFMRLKNQLENALTKLIRERSY